MKKILFVAIVFLCYLPLQAQVALRFDGVDDYAQVNSYKELDLDINDFTVEAMVSNLDFSLSDTLTILSKTNASFGQGISWFITKNTICLQVGTKQYGVNYSITNCAHLVVIRKNASLLFYANHVLIETKPIADTINATCIACDLLMGKDIKNNNYFKGKLDEVRIWNVARSLMDIEAFEATYLDSTTMLSASLIGYWNFEENTGNIANNIGSIPNYAILHNDGFSRGLPEWSYNSCAAKTYSKERFVDFKRKLDEMADSPYGDKFGPIEGDLVTFTNTSTTGKVEYWIANGETIRFTNSVQFRLQRRNVIQLVVATKEGIMVKTTEFDAMTSMW